VRVASKSGPSPRQVWGSGVTDRGRIEAPFLQLVLTRLWEEETRRHSRSMRAATLRELGGAEQIVREHLDRVLDGATPDELAVIAAAFGYLVTPRRCARR